MSTRPLALITGASAGIGREFAHLIAADGYDLVLVARRADRLAELRAELPGTVHLLPMDLAAPDAGFALVAKLAEQNFVVDVLVNNAGFGAQGPFVEADAERLTTMVDLNVRTLVDLSRRLLPPMLEKGSGGILNLASLASFLPGPNLAVYYATKAFVLSFSEAINEECRGSGVTVSALCPGPTHSEFGSVANMEKSRLFRYGIKMTAHDVAAIGWRGFKKGRPVVVPGLANKLTAIMSQVTPHRVLLPIGKFLQSAPR